MPPQFLLQDDPPPTTGSPPTTDDIGATDIAGNASESADNLLEAFVDALPRIGIGLAIIVASYIAGKILRRYLEPRLAERRSESFGRVISRLISYGVIIAGFAIGFTAIFPSIKPVDLIAGLGVFSIALGFAFQDILSNLLAGLLLLIRQPFEAGDQIEVNGQRGTVQGITIRETQIKTFDGEKVIIPNAAVYQNTIRVQTAYGPKRTNLVVGLDDWEDLDRAADVVLESIADIDGIQTDPAPQAYFTDFGESVTNMDLRYWTEPQQAEVRRVQDQVIRAVGRALKEANIAMPSPIREIDVRKSVVDLTEATMDPASNSGAESSSTTD